MLFSYMPMMGVLYIGRKRKNKYNFKQFIN